MPDITVLKVRVDGVEFNYTVADMNDSWVLTFEYSHSTHLMEIYLNPNAIPEFSSPLIGLLFAIMTALVAFCLGKRKWHALSARVTRQNFVL